MYREIYNDLLKWKNKKNKKPLVLFGARQTGKTWILKEFGRKEYINVAYVNCDNNEIIRNAFEDYDIQRLIRVFSAISNERIEEEKTLIILDEIQEVPKALTSLKYFNESDNKYDIAVAGSLLGISVHEGSGYPVGNVEELKIFPMSFEEFLIANDKKILVENIKKHLWEDTNVLSGSYKELLRQYYFTGGMPEVVDCYIKTQDLKETRRIQERIISDYQNDFSKHIPNNLLTKVRLVYDSIPSQLAKENKKFIYGAVKKGSRAKDYEDAIQWLLDAGLVYAVPRIKKISMPLKFYEEKGIFKLYFSDLGLLGAFIGVPASQILVSDNIFEEYKGSFTEQYVVQQILMENIKPYYYKNESSQTEIDFVIQKEEVFPIEVKAEENLKSKSLKVIKNTYPQIRCWRFSMSGYRDQGWMVNVPLYLIQEWIRCN